MEFTYPVGVAIALILGLTAITIKDSNDKCRIVDIGCTIAVILISLLAYVAVVPFMLLFLNELIKKGGI